MSWLFEQILFIPVFNLLIFIYNIIPYKDLGISIILLTILIRLMLYPLSQKALKSQKDLQALQPKMKEIQEKYKDDKEMQGKEMMKLYSENKVNPFSACLPILIQLPFLIAVYSVLRKVSVDSLHYLYGFISAPESINNIFIGLIDLTKPNIVLAVLAGITQFIQSKMMTATKQPAVAGSSDEIAMANANKSMLYVMPLITVIIGASLPAGLTLYWFITTLLMLVQQYFVLKKKKNKFYIQNLHILKRANYSSF